MQDRVNVLVLVKATVVSVPVRVLLPDQPPDAVHELALVLDHVSKDVLPLITLVGLAVKDTVGAGTLPLTVTVADCVAVPPVPVQLNVKVLVLLSAALVCAPDVPLVPVHAPDAVHELAFVDDQFNIDVLPLVTLAGLAESVSVGAAVGAATLTVSDWLALPPAPVHVNV